MSEFHGVIWTVDIIYEGITYKYMKDYFFVGEMNGSNWQWELEAQSIWPSLEQESRTMVELEWDSEAKNLGRK